MKNRGTKLNSAELAMFFSSMYFLLDAGTIANEAPEIIATDIDSKALETVCLKITSLLESGEATDFSDAAKQTGAFPSYAVKMMYLGEISGRFENICKALGGYYRNQDILNSTIRNSITSSLVLLTIMSIILVFLIFYVLPIFQQVFNSLGTSTEDTMYVALISSKIILGITLIFLLFIVLHTALFFNSHTRHIALRLFEYFPPTRNIISTIAISQFTQGLSMLIASGIDSASALGYIAPLVHNKNIKKNIGPCQEKVEAGEDLGSALVESSILDGFEAKILLSAGRAGKTPLAMERLAEYYSQRATTEVESLTSNIEPLLVAILSIAIGIILLSVVLPLIGIMSSL